MRTKNSLLMALLLLSLSCPLLAEPPKVLRLIQFADIHAGGRHFEPKIWDAARVEGLGQLPDAVLMLGDQCDNSREQKTFWERLRGFMSELKTELQGVTVPFMFVLGNDDLQLNYQTNPDLLQEVSKIFRDALGQRYYLDELGNGVHPQKVGGLTWLSINSLCFSPYNQYPGAPEQARKTLDWLQAQLKQAGTSPAVILSHVPPTWDLHSRQPAWRTEYLRELRRILLAHPGPVTILCGHYHRNHVQGLRRPQGDVPILTGGSLSSKYGYRSNWRDFRWTLDTQGRLDQIDYTLHYPGHPEWMRRYQLSAQHMEDFRTRLKTDDAFYENYLLDIYGHHADAEDWINVPFIREAVVDEFWLEP